MEQAAGVHRNKNVDSDKISTQDTINGRCIRGTQFSSVITMTYDSCVIIMDVELTQPTSYIRKTLLDRTLCAIHIPTREMSIPASHSVPLRLAVYNWQQYSTRKWTHSSTWNEDEQRLQNDRTIDETAMEPQTVVANSHTTTIQPETAIESAATTMSPEQAESSRGLCLRPAPERQNTTITTLLYTTCNACRRRDMAVEKRKRNL